jgi:transcriptional regulator with XRE-family HTH domain
MFEARKKMSEQQLFVIVGGKIREKRKALNLTQTELAALCNFEKASVSRMEAGKSNITLSTLFKLSVALQTPVKNFFE